MRFKTVVMLGLLLSVSNAGPPTSRAQAEAPGLEPLEPAVDWVRAHVVLDGATVWTVSGEVYAPGWVEINEGRILRVGSGAAPKVEGAEVLDLQGKHVTPGLIDTHSHLGVYPSPRVGAHADGNEATKPVTAGVWAEHSVWPQDPGFRRAVQGGVTTLQILPGSANLVGGRGVVLQLLPARGARAMRFPGAPETVKLACGENPKRVYKSRGPSTRMGNLHGQRKAFIEAEAYRKKWKKYEDKAKTSREEREAWKRDNARRIERGRDPKDPKPKGPGDPPTRDLDKDTLAGVLDGQILPQIHCYRADDMLSMLQVAQEFGFRVRSFHHAVEAYKIRELLAEHEVSVSTWADWWGFKLEAHDAVMANAALLHASGARAIIHSDSEIGIQRLNQEAAKALRAGRELGLDLSESDALSWITANAAWALGIQDQTGRLATGPSTSVRRVRRLRRGGGGLGRLTPAPSERPRPPLAPCTSTSPDASTT